MQIFLLHLTLFISFLLVEVAFLGILFPAFPAPLIITSAVVVWTLLLGFRRALLFTVPLTLLYDVFVSGQIQPFSVYMVAVAYLVSFLSRRLVVEHQGLATLLYAGILAGAAGGYQIFLALLENRTPWVTFQELSYGSFILTSFFVFWIVYGVLNRFHRYIERLRMESILFTR